MEYRQAGHGKRLFSAFIYFADEIQEPGCEPKKSTICFAVAPSLEVAEQLLRKRYEVFGAVIQWISVKLAAQQNLNCYSAGTEILGLGPAVTKSEPVFSQALIDRVVDQPKIRCLLKLNRFSDHSLKQVVREQILSLLEEEKRGQAGTEVALR